MTDRRLPAIESEHRDQQSGEETASLVLCDGGLEEVGELLKFLPTKKDFKRLRGRAEG